MWHIPEVHSHHHRNHNVECSEWSSSGDARMISSAKRVAVANLRMWRVQYDLSLYDEITLRKTPSVCLCFGKKSLVNVDSACFSTEHKTRKWNVHRYPSLKSVTVEDACDEVGRKVRFADETINPSPLSYQLYLIVTSFVQGLFPTEM
jgi:hypothetical protein